MNSLLILAPAFTRAARRKHRFASAMHRALRATVTRKATILPILIVDACSDRFANGKSSTL